MKIADNRDDDADDCDEESNSYFSYRSRFRIPGQELSTTRRALLNRFEYSTFDAAVRRD